MRHEEWRERNDRIARIVQEGRANARGWVRVHCPFCVSSKTGLSTDSLAFNNRTGYWHCLRCAARGRLAGEWQDLPPVPTLDESPEVPLPEEYIPLDDDDSAASVALLDAYLYLASRGVHREQISIFRIGACLRGKYAGRIIVPVTDPRGRAFGFVARDWTRHAERPYLYPPGMPRGSLLYQGALLSVESDTPILIVEGVFDAIATHPYGVAAFGFPGEEHLRLIREAKRPVVMCLDADAYERAWGLAMLLRLDGLRAGVVRLPPKKDPDQVPLHALLADASASLEREL